MSEAGDRAPSTGTDRLDGAFAFPAMAMISAAVMLVEVSVTRVLAYRLFYHYVYMVIGTALLGLSAGAAAVTLRSIRGRSLGRRALGHSSLAFAALIPVVLLALTRFTPAPNLSAGKIEGPAAFVFLTECYLLLTGLFFTAGLVTAILFSRLRERASTLYAADLLGAAWAAVTAVVVMKYGTPLRAFLAAGVLAAAVAAYAAAGRSRAVALGLALANLCLMFPATSLFDPARNHAGSIRQPDAWSWNHQARVDFYGPTIIIDADAATHQAPLVDGPVPPDAPSSFGFEYLAEIPYEILPPDSSLEVAVLGAGGGPDVYMALKHQAARVFAIEINQIIARSQLREPRSVYNKPQVVAIVGEGRHTLRALETRFDLIQLSLVDTFTASASGAYALSENYLYTVEAFEEYLAHLRPGGVLSISRWQFDPPRETLRLCALAHEALRRRGVADPSRHVAMIDSDWHGEDRRVGTFLMSPEPLDEATIARATGAAARHRYSVAYLPGGGGDNPFYRFFAARDKQEFYRGYRFSVDPVADSRPFFFQYFRPGLLREALRSGWSFIFYMSQVVLFLTLGLSVLLSLLIVLLPIARLGRSGNRLSTAVYFGSLGLGFMLAEIPLIQHFTLYLGHPTHALVTVLSTLLVGAGIGSLVAGRIPLGRPSRVAIGCVALLVAGSIRLVPALTGHTIGFGLVARMALSLGLLGTLGLALGLPLTLGFRSIAARGERLAAWAWAVNGAASVVSSSLAMIILVYLGFSWAVGLGALCYALALVSLPRSAA